MGIQLGIQFIAFFLKLDNLDTPLIIIRIISIYFIKESKGIFILNKKRILNHLYMKHQDSIHQYLQDIQAQINNRTRVEETDKSFYKTFHGFKDANTAKVDEQFDALLEWYDNMNLFKNYGYSQEKRTTLQMIQRDLEELYPPVQSTWLTPEQLEEEYGISKNWQSKARMQSSKTYIPYHKKYGHIFYKRVEIDAWIEEGKVQ